VAACWQPQAADPASYAIRQLALLLHPPRAGNLEVAFMHLTNYAVNKTNASFAANTSTGATTGGGSGDGSDSSKWHLLQLQQHLEARGVDWDKVGGQAASS
jgi:hypothetical protein